MQILKFIALLPLSDEGQRAIIESKNNDLIKTLISSNYISDKSLSLLKNTKNRDINHIIYKKINNFDYINNSYDLVNDCCKAYIGRNPNISIDNLNKMAESKNRELVLSVLINKNSTLELKKSISIDHIIKYVKVAPPLGNTVVRSLEVLFNNTWLLEYTDLLNHSLKRAGLSYPYLSEEIFSKLNDRPLRRYGNLHPLSRFGTTIDKMNLNDNELISLNSPSVDFYLVNKNDLNISSAYKMLNRSDFYTEPNFIARLLERFGVDVIPKTEVNYLAKTRIDSTAWLSPLANYYNDIIKLKNSNQYETLLNANNILDNNYEAWSNFISLSNNWLGSVEDLVDASLSL
jgi:hypothetical protein